MKKLIVPSSADIKIHAPSSKSFLQRAIALALLAEGKTVIEKPTYSDDVKAALSVAESLGAELGVKPDSISITGGVRQVKSELNCGEAGLCIRMFSAVASLISPHFTISGKASLMKRPAGIISDALEKFGMRCKSRNGFPPLEISGKFKGAKAEIDGSLSSQVLTGLLIALPKAENDSHLIVKNLKSTPYIDLTLDLIEKFGGKIEHNNYKDFFIRGKQKYNAFVGKAEGDWSGAAFPAVAGVISGSAEIAGLDFNSPQADIALLDALKLSGADFKIKNGKLICKKTNKLNAFEFDAENCPDLFPPLVALATYADGKSVISGAKRLTHKESNRAESLKIEFGKIGIKINVEGNKMFVEGGKPRGGKVFSHNDHRIAAALAVAGLSAESPTEIEAAESVNKSYPDFFSDLIG